MEEQEEEESVDGEAEAEKLHFDESKLSPICDGGLRAERMEMAMQTRRDEDEGEDEGDPDINISK